MTIFLSLILALTVSFFSVPAQTAQTACESTHAFASQSASSQYDFDLLCQPVLFETIELEPGDTITVNVSLDNYYRFSETANADFQLRFSMQRAHLKIRQPNTLVEHDITDGESRIRNIDVSTGEDVYTTDVTNAGVRTAIFDISVHPLDLQVTPDETLPSSTSNCLTQTAFALQPEPGMYVLDPLCQPLPLNTFELTPDERIQVVINLDNYRRLFPDLEAEFNLHFALQRAWLQISEFGSSGNMEITDGESVMHDISLQTDDATYTFILENLGFRDAIFNLTVYPSNVNIAQLDNLDPINDETESAIVAPTATPIEPTFTPTDTPTQTSTVTPAPTATAIPSATPVVAAVTGNNINARSCASQQCSVVTVVTSQDQIVILGRSNDWYWVELADGRTAFIFSDLVNLPADAMIAMASSMTPSPAPTHSPTAQPTATTAPTFVFSQDDLLLLIRAALALDGYTVDSLEMRRGQLTLNVPASASGFASELEYRILVLGEFTGATVAAFRDETPRLTPPTDMIVNFNIGTVTVIRVSFSYENAFKFINGSLTAEELFASMTVE